MHDVRLDPVEGTSQESRSRIRSMDVVGTNDQEPSQQMKQAKLAFVELYQKNGDLRQHLATNTIEVSVAQHREGNVTWLKIHLIETQDTIVQLREA
jgi:hypothetical protein